MKRIAEQLRMVEMKGAGIYVSFYIPAKSDQSRNTIRREIDKWKGKDFTIEITAAPVSEDRIERWRGGERAI